MVEISFASNIRELDRYLGRVAADQVPFALARSLTRTAKEVGQPAYKRGLERELDRPTRFTLAAPRVIPARKSRPVAVVTPKTIQEQYLLRLATGGVRVPAGAAVLVPVGARLNRYGNLARGAVDRLLARPDTFSGVIDGVGGIWQRKGRKVKLLIRYEPRTRYAPQLDLAPHMLPVVGQAFLGIFERELLEAIRTAR